MHSARYPDKAKLWDYEKNSPVTPSMISYGSTQNFWWLCKKSKHSFDMNPSTFSRKDINCPICSGKRIIFENSLAGKYPFIAKEWDYQKNGDLKPSKIPPNSKEKFWWICPENHSYKSTPNNRISIGFGCSICSCRKPAEGESFSELYPDLSEYLLKDKRNKIDANATPIGSHAKLVTNCLECKKILEKEVRNWIKVYKKLGVKSYICNVCRNLVRFNNELVSLDHLQELYGLPKGLIQGRLGHVSTVENALNAGL